MRKTLLILLLTSIFCAQSRAAEVSPVLAFQLKNAQADEYVPAIVLLESPLDIAALDQSLHERGASYSERYDAVYSALQYNVRQTQPHFVAELESAKRAGLVRGWTTCWIDNLVVVSATREYLEGLAERGDIRALTENFRAELIEPAEAGSPDDLRARRRSLDQETTLPGQDAIGATRVQRELGITGQGTLVANLDTGVDGTHPALASRWRGNFAPASECWLDVLGTGTQTPVDDHSHGTHVMGTMCGRELDVNGDTLTIGTAPDALWIAVNAIDQGVGQDFNNDVIECFQWFANPDLNPQTLDDVPDVVQNSWGVSDFFPGYDECFDYWNGVITNLEALGVVAIFSAGNEGAGGLRSPAIHSLSPVQMFSVGAVRATEDDVPPYEIAGFSSLGPSYCDGTHTKPEIVAPGSSVYSSIPGGYTVFSGTSMAGPHVAGVVALMRQACPDCDPITLKEVLIHTAIDSGYGSEGQDNTFGYGFLDAYSAVLAVTQLGYLTGTVTSSGTGLPDVEIEVLETGALLATDAQGHYDVPIVEGSYTLRFRKYSYLPWTESGVVITRGDSTIVDAELDLASDRSLSGHVYDADGEALGGAVVKVRNAPILSVTTDVSGSYELELPAGYTYLVQATGPQGAAANEIEVIADMTVDFRMPAMIVHYDFEVGDQGWTVGQPTDNAITGVWNRMDPQQTVGSNGHVIQPENDFTPGVGVNCFVTDGNAGSSGGAFDVDGGATTLFSPVWDFSGLNGVVLETHTWFSNDNGSNPGEDALRMDVSPDGGLHWLPLLSETVDWEEWRRHVFLLEDYVELTSEVQIRVVAADFGPGSIVEAALDEVSVYAAAVEAPQALTARITDSGVQLTWNSVPGATGYRVWRTMELPATTTNSTLLASVADTTYLDTMVLDTIGYYVVTAFR
ncbi:MAG: S8 family serine peptidase [Calditrichaeota bacterium]|nr:S8 family serine peptidase [Calditrichota bacterium]